MSHNQIIPRVFERIGRTEYIYDIYSRLLKDRIVFLGGEIDEDVANLVVAQFLFLSNDDPHADISLYVNSPGGSVTAGLAIYDTMQFVRPDVATYCIGEAMSMGAILLAAGTPGKRHALPNSRILIHQPLRPPHNYVQRVTELEISGRELLRLRDRLYEIISRHTGRPIEQVAEDCDWDKWLDAKEAMEYGLVDQIYDRMPPTPEPEGDAKK